MASEIEDYFDENGKLKHGKNNLSGLDLQGWDLADKTLTGGNFSKIISGGIINQDITIIGAKTDNGQRNIICTNTESISLKERKMYFDGTWYVVLNEYTSSPSKTSCRLDVKAAGKFKEYNLYGYFESIFKDINKSLKF